MVSPAAQYAAVRNGLYQNGKKIEIMVNFQPKLHYFSEWWKQLYGESEGKDLKGIFPASVDFTTDLHSMGQWIQEGERTIFETVISVETPEQKLLFPSDEENLDGLNFLAGKRVDEVNKMAELGTQLAHVDGGVPNMRISMPRLNERYLGQLIYFFEIACGIRQLDRREPNRRMQRAYIEVPYLQPPLPTNQTRVSSVMSHPVL